MKCQACGTENVSLEARISSGRLDTLPETALMTLHTNLDTPIDEPVMLCAEHLLPHASAAIAAQFAAGQEPVIV